ncbi:hypothetical protein YC2023_086332 [Brassica napus]
MRRWGTRLTAREKKPNRMFSFEEFCRKIYCVGLLGLLISLVGSLIFDINKTLRTSD